MEIHVFYVNICLNVDLKFQECYRVFQQSV